ncbi:hypothetical protein H2201_007679 [Coniosporium apollinis]|uniref:Uncharacterized protein n=1 Tax=Coniosporium apollinis TaxID=61459 RepID=A0ABQ9NQ45_9PEZI|nr:hypothetical protein H2201_007679 [Coniosporium apollinis]
MAIKHAAWTHGSDIQLESLSWRALRQGYWTTVRPGWEGRFGWVHFAIPTPVIVDGVRLKAESAMIRFKTGKNATITSFHVYDGERKIASHDGLNLRSDQPQFYRRDIPGDPQVLWGTNISLGIEFDGDGADAWVALISAGIDFYA